MSHSEIEHSARPIAEAFGEIKFPMGFVIFNGPFGQARFQFCAKDIETWLERIGVIIRPSFSYLVISQHVSLGKHQLILMSPFAQLNVKRFGFDFSAERKECKNVIWLNGYMEFVILVVHVLS